MANIIDKTYFEGTLLIPGLETPYREEVLTDIISRGEPEVLTILFGYKMYKALEAARAINPVPVPWFDLLNGADYTDQNGVLSHWLGLQNAAKRSLIANYCYYQYLEANSSQTTPTGEVVATNENSMLVNASEKLVRSWNEFVGYAFELDKFIRSNSANYPDYSPQAAPALINSFGL